MTLLNGTPDVEASLGNASDILRAFIATEIAAHLKKRDFMDAVTGFFRMDAVSQERANIVLGRLRELADKWT